MKIREQITATADFPAEPWLTHDILNRNAAWLVLAGKCRDAAEARGLAVIENDPAEERSMLYLKTAGKPAGVFQVECPRSEATLVRLRLSAWAEPK